MKEEEDTILHETVGKANSLGRRNGIVYFLILAMHKKIHLASLECKQRLKHCYSLFQRRNKEEVMSASVLI